MSILVVALLWLLQFSLVSSLVGAFAPMMVPSVNRPRKTVRFAETDDQVPAPEADAASESSSDERVKPSGESPMEPGTHEELMYALGVNLARQLGDVRPLVDNGDELANVAKGLLDTVIGRLTAEGQEGLLARRGQDLNTIIQERA